MSKLQQVLVLTVHFGFHFPVVTVMALSFHSETAPLRCQLRRQYDREKGRYIDLYMNNLKPIKESDHNSKKNFFFFFGKKKSKRPS